MPHRPALDGTAGARLPKVQKIRPATLALLSPFPSSRRHQREVLDGLNPPCLTQVEIGLSEDVLETLVVSEDLTTVSLQIVTPCLQSMDNRCELEVMCGIVEFMGRN